MKKFSALLYVVFILTMVNCYGSQDVFSQPSEQVTDSESVSSLPTVTPSPKISLGSQVVMTESVLERPTNTPIATPTIIPVLLNPSEVISTDSISDLELLHTFELDTSNIWSVSFSKDGNLLGAALADGKYKLWNIATLQELRTSVYIDNPSMVLFSRSEDQILVAEHNGYETHIWDLVTGELMYNLSGMPFQGGFALSNDGNIAATLSSDRRNIILSDLSDLLSNRAFKVMLGDWRPESPDDAHAYDFPYYVFFSPDDSLLVAGLSNRTIIWDVRTGERIKELEEKNALAFSPDGTVLAVRDRIFDIALYDVSTWENFKILNDSYARYHRPALFSHNGDLLIAIIEDLSIHVWDWDISIPLQTLSTYSSDLVLSQDGTILVSYFELSDEIYLWGVP